MFLLAFSVDSPTSFELIQSKFIPEVTHHCPDARLVLCANKIDLRNDDTTIQNLSRKGQSVITFEQGIVDFFLWYHEFFL